MATRRKNLILTPPERKGTPIKLRLDARTVVMVKNAKALAFWKERYPKAEVIEDQRVKKATTTVKRGKQTATSPNAQKRKAG